MAQVKPQVGLGVCHTVKGNHSRISTQSWMSVSLCPDSQCLRKGVLMLCMLVCQWGDRAQTSRTQSTMCTLSKILCSIQARLCRIPLHSSSSVASASNHDLVGSHNTPRICTLKIHQVTLSRMSCFGVEMGQLFGHIRQCKQIIPTECGSGSLPIDYTV